MAIPYGADETIRRLIQFEATLPRGETRQLVHSAVMLLEETDPSALTQAEKQIRKDRRSA